MLVTNITLSSMSIKNILSSQITNITYEVPTRPHYNIWYGYDIMSKHIQKLYISSNFVYAQYTSHIKTHITCYI